MRRSKKGEMEGEKGGDNTTKVCVRTSVYMGACGVRTHMRAKKCINIPAIHSEKVVAMCCVLWM